MSMIFDVSDAENRIKYTFKNKSLLRQAFTHSSYSNENNVQSNERLEFLGDSVLNFIIAEYLYKKFPDLDEGELTKMRASVVSATPLAESASDLDLNGIMLLGEGEKKTENKSFNIFADLFESIVAAIYIDSDLRNVRKFILFALKKQIAAATGHEVTDSKSKLSELCQKKYKKKVRYVTIKQEGPPHSPVFTVAAVIGGKTFESATAENKKAAQQIAAKNALKAINKELKFEF